MTLNAARTDLISRNEAFETLALSFIGSGKPSQGWGGRHSQKQHARTCGGAGYTGMSVPAPSPLLTTTRSHHMHTCILAQSMPTSHLLGFCAPSMLTLRRMLIPSCSWRVRD